MVDRAVREKYLPVKRSIPLQALAPIIGVALFGVSVVILHHELRDYRYHDLLHEARRLSGATLGTALALTAASYFLLTVYDAIAIRYIGAALSYAKIAFASFVGYTLSHNLGFSILTGGAARFRLFTAWGLTPIQIAQGLAFSNIAYWLGFFMLIGAILCLEPSLLANRFVHSESVGVAVGVMLILGGAWGAYFICGRRSSFRVKEWEFPSPSPRLAAGAMGIAAFDWVLAASVAYTLLPHGHVSLLRFVGVFQLSQLLGVLSNVPGGLGVFETSILLLLNSGASKGAIVGGLVVYRLVYYVFPFVLSLLLLAAYEAKQQLSRIVSVAERIHSHAALVVPPFFTAAVFVSGVVLLSSGATPAMEDRLLALERLLPLSTVEASHFLGSIAGVSLLILARGLQRRLDAAYALSLAVLFVGIVASLAKGFDYEEALLLSIVLVLLIPCRSFFYRKASLLREPFSPSWTMSLAVVLIATSWLIFFRYKHVEYSHALWWQFSFFSDAPRSLRALVGSISLSLVYAMARALAPADPPSVLSSNDQLAHARNIIERSPAAYGALALLGDKSLLFSESGNAFIMYAVEGQTWVALSDPVGDSAEFPELIWQFRELGDQFGGTCVFYEVGAQNLHLYVETGLDFLKLGEEAVVHLPGFTLDGKSKSSLRHTRNRLTKEGCRLRIASASEVPVLLPRLKAISDSWLDAKRSKEKRFSLGFFHPPYILQFPVALIERDNTIVAFANIWPGDGRHEISVDLMRYSSDAPSGVMEYLFLELMLWARDEGYERFNLGMAPFSGFEERKLAPLWNTIGRIVYERGEKLYNFQGLRHFKEKFGPVWEPKYLAAPGGFGLAATLRNIASLISGGVRGIVTK